MLVDERKSGVWKTWVYQSDERSQRNEKQMMKMSETVDLNVASQRTLLKYAVDGLWA